MGTSTEAVTVAGTDAITRKAVKLGASVVGTASGPVKDMPLGVAQYQQFSKGVIVFSDDNGAVFLTQAVFDKWLSLQGQSNAEGGDAYAFIGLPQADYTSVFNTQGVVATTASFDRGQLIVPKSAPARVVSGAMYARYAKLSSQLGLPTAEEVVTPDGSGMVQTFEKGELYFKSSLTEAYASWDPILSYWKSLGGPSGSLGYPTEEPKPAGSAGIGLSQTFEGGAIFQNAATGIFKLDKNNLLTSYQQFGGPSGWLGFPKGGGTSSAGDLYVEFESGILVNHTNSDVNGVAGVYPFSDLSFHFEHVAGHGSDCTFCGGLDVYTYLTVNSSNGLITPTQRIPGSGDGGQDFHPNIADAPIGKVSAALTVDVSLEAWDADDSSNDDFLGSTSAHYSIDNLWGVAASTNHSGSNGDHSMDADFNIKNTYPYDATDFRGQMFWSFHNFKTPELSYDQFAASFTDVDPDETWWHPLNKLYYAIAYKKVAKKGNCFGMSLESIYAQRGNSLYAEPIHQYFPDTQNGQDLTTATQDGAHTSLENQLNIKHGYQLGLNEVLYMVGAFTAGITHDPLANFALGLATDSVGDTGVLGIYDSYLFGGAHVVRPYKWEPLAAPCSSTNPLSPCMRIHVADPNFPIVAGGPAQPDDFIEIDPSIDYYRYAEYNGDYNGGILTGGRMLFTPYRLLSHDQITPLAAFTNPFELINDGILVVLGDTGQANQISDDTGRTFFEPGLSGPPTKWDDIRHDPSARIQNFAPIMPAVDDAFPGQIYAGLSMTGRSQDYDVVPPVGTPAHTPYDAIVSTGKLASAFSIPGTPGIPDRISAEQIGSTNKGISFTVPANSESKAITWTVMGLNKFRWAEFSDMNVVPSQKLRMHVENGGYRVVIENSGPATSGVLRVSSGFKTPPVTVGRVPIPSGTSTQEFQLPTSTLTVSGQVQGKNGWLVAPVALTINTFDYSGTGVKAEYGPDGTTWLPYSSPVSYATQGQSVVYYRAHNNAGNLGLTQSQPFMIDSQAPTAIGTITPGANVKLSYAVSDPVPGSGVAGVHVISQAAGGGNASAFIANSSGSVTLQTSCSALEFWGEDVAGNMSAHTVLADTTPPVITAPATIATTHCTAAAGLALGVTAKDDCGVVSLTSNAPSKFPLGTTVVTWTAKDAAGNTTTAIQQVTTELGDDASCCPTGSNVIMGTLSNDTLNGTAGNDCIIGLGGQDTIKGLGGNDVISGGEGNDIIYGGDGNDSLYGGTGGDQVFGDAGADICYGDDGDDIVHGGAGNDVLSGGQGQDQLFCEDGDDTADGGVGVDKLDGGLGNDRLVGGPDQDTLSGGGGVDQCVQDGMDILQSTCHAVSP